MARLPMFLTVEEAARLLRIGRTKAYAMAKQWRLTGGQCGLPVVDLDGVLRVPLAKLQQLTGVDFSHWDPPPPIEPRIFESERPSSEAKAATDEPQHDGATPDDPVTPPARRGRKAKRDQLDLFPPPSPSY